MDRRVCGVIERQPRRLRPAGLSLFCSESVAAELCDRAAGEPEGARPASDAINRGHAEATPQAIACGVVAVKKYSFLTKGLQSAARIICAPRAHKFHTCSLRSIFSAAHVAGENDRDFLSPLRRRNSTRFLNKLSRHPAGKSLRGRCYQKSITFLKKGLRPDGCASEPRHRKPPAAQDASCTAGVIVIQMGHPGSALTSSAK